MDHKERILQMLAIASDMIEESLRGKGPGLTQDEIDEVYKAIRGLDAQVEPASHRAGSGG